MFPSIDEIYYCIKKRLVCDKDLILFKLIIDFHEAVYNNYKHASSDFAAQKLVPCSINFYKQLSEGQVESMLKQMKSIDSKIEAKSNLRKVSDAVKHDFEHQHLRFERVFEWKPRDPQDDDDSDCKPLKSKDDFL